MMEAPFNVFGFWVKAETTPFFFPINLQNPDKAEG